MLQKAGALTKNPRYMFTPSDIKQFQAKGIDIETIEQQIENFKNGFPYMDLVAPATPGHGIRKFTEAEADKLVAFYDKYVESYEILKFVPASGAASRMFKTLFEFRDECRKSTDIQALIENRPIFKHLSKTTRVLIPPITLSKTSGSLPFIPTLRNP